LDDQPVRRSRRHVAANIGSRGGDHDWLPGVYAVRVRNTGVAPIDYPTKLVTTMAWF
jgi:hypothetical protein